MSDSRKIYLNEVDEQPDENRTSNINKIATIKIKILIYFTYF